MSTRIDLGGRRVLVTGASSGVGAAVCRSIVRHGGTVAMLARRQERLDELSRELGEHAIGVPCDVTDLAALEQAIGEAARFVGQLDSVIAVAGRSMVGTIPSGSPQGWRELVDLNLVAPLATVRYALPHFPRKGRRDVVFIGSVGGITPMPGTGIYAATKRGLHAAFDALRLELAPMGVGASLVMPGMFMTEGLMETLAINGEPPVSDLPMFTDDSGPASPDVLADAITFLLSMPEGVTINEMVVRPTGQLNP